MLQNEIVKQSINLISFLLIQSGCYYTATYCSVSYKITEIKIKICIFNLPLTSLKMSINIYIYKDVFVYVYIIYLN